METPMTDDYGTGYKHGFVDALRQITAEVITEPVQVVEDVGNLQFEGVQTTAKSVWTDDPMAPEDFAGEVSLWMQEDPGASIVNGYAMAEETEGANAVRTSFAMDSDTGALQGAGAQGWVFEARPPDMVQVWHNGKPYGYFTGHPQDVHEWTPGHWAE